MLAAASFNCRLITRERVTPYPVRWPHRAPWKLDRELLFPETTRHIVFVVDHVTGREPRAEALDHLVEIASRYGERNSTWVELGDPESRDVTWTETRVGASVFHQEISCARPLRSDTSYVFVRYIGETDGIFGASKTFEAPTACGVPDYHVIYIPQDVLDRIAVLWLTGKRLEERALVHEYGHLLGLATNPAHGFWRKTTPYSKSPHCVNPDCAMSIPTKKAIRYTMYRTGLTFRNVRDYCNACARDIERAKRHWRTGEEFEPVRRLPQPDPSWFIKTLEVGDFRSGGKALEALDYGKAAVPALMDRMRTLPTGGPDSPRGVASRLVKTILLMASGRRSLDRGLVNSRLDESDVLLAWWPEQRERFLNGDDWILPRVFRE